MCVCVCYTPATITLIALPIITIAKRLPQTVPHHGTPPPTPHAFPGGGGCYLSQAGTPALGGLAIIYLSCKTVVKASQLESI